MTLDELRSNRDWAHVFGEVEDCDNTTSNIEPIGDCPADPVNRADVVEIIAASEVDNSHGWEGAGVFRLSDGRYLFARGWCDYTGWN